MSADRIEIKFFDFDSEDMGDFRAFIRLRYVAWARNGVGEFGFAAPAPGNGPIPDDVRIALAMLVAPGLVVESAFVRDGLRDIQAELHLQRGRLGEQMDLAKEKAP